MGLIFIIMLGAMLGWVATIIFRQSSLAALKVNAMLGMVGALIGGLIINPLFGFGNLLRGENNAEALLISLLCSLALLLTINLFRQRQTR